MTADEARRAAAYVRELLACGYLRVGVEPLQDLDAVIRFAEQGGDPVARLKPEATFRLAVNGHAMAGERWGGRWVLSCKSFPDLAEKYQDVADASDARDEFLRRAAPPVITEGDAK